MGATLCCGELDSRCSGFSGCRAQALGAQVSGVAARGLSSCGPRAQQLCGLWDLPRLAIEALQWHADSLSTVPPGKSQLRFLEEKIDIFECTREQNKKNF